jgi:hypothetical protein
MIECDDCALSTCDVAANDYDARSLRWCGAVSTQFNWLKGPADDDTDWDKLWACLSPTRHFPNPSVEAEVFKTPPFDDLLEVNPSVVSDLWNWLNLNA